MLLGVVQNHLVHLDSSRSLGLAIGGKLLGGALGAALLGALLDRLPEVGQALLRVVRHDLGLLGSGGGGFVLLLLLVLLVLGAVSSSSSSASLSPSGSSSGSLAGEYMPSGPCMRLCSWRAKVVSCFFFFAVLAVASALFFSCAIARVLMIWSRWASFPSLPERFAWELHQSTRAFFTIWSYFLRTFCAFRCSPGEDGVILDHLIELQGRGGAGEGGRAEEGQGRGESPSNSIKQNICWLTISNLPAFSPWGTRRCRATPRSRKEAGSALGSCSCCGPLPLEFRIRSRCCRTHGQRSLKVT